MLAALVGLTILGIAMILLTWLGARVVRRYMNPSSHKPERSRFSEFGVDNWAEKPISADTDHDEEDETSGKAGSG